MANSLQILPDGDRWETSRADAFPLVVSGIAYVAIGCAFYAAGSAQWAEGLAIFGVMNWVRAAWLRTRLPILKAISLA
jgi:hypothetical protein